MEAQAFDKIVANLQDSNLWLVLLSNGTIAFGLNLSVFLLIGKTSALTMNVAGVVKDWLTHWLVSPHISRSGMSLLYLATSQVYPSSVRIQVPLAWHSAKGILLLLSRNDVSLSEGSRQLRRIVVQLSHRLPCCADQCMKPGGIQHCILWRVLVQLHKAAGHASKAGTAGAAADQSPQKGRSERT